MAFLALGTVHLVDTPKELTVAIFLLPKVLFGHGKAAFSFGCSGFCLGVAAPPKLIRLKCANHHPEGNPS